MNDRTVIHNIRLDFSSDFGGLAGADLMAEAKRLRAEHLGLPASAVLAHWRGATSASLTRLIHHPLGVNAPVALVAGRHTACDLGRIPGASLRHAIILLWPPDGAGEPPFAEVLDLGTRSGIALPDGRLAARLASSSPIRFGVASADVVILHALAGEPLSLEPAALSMLLRETSERAEVSARANQPFTRHLDVSDSAARQADGSHDKSCIEVPVEPSAGGTFGSEHSMLTQIVHLDEGHVSPRVNVRAEDLERGVRLGRYLRCRGASVLGRADHVSRVHALVLDRGGRRWLFDTASTNGTAVVNVNTGVATGPVRGKRTFALHEGQAPSLAGQVALLAVGTPAAPS